MPYAQARTSFDADSHLMETSDWLVGYADPELRDRIRPLYLGGAGAMAEQAVVDAEARRGDEQAAVELEGALMKTKGWNALGPSIPRNEAEPSTSWASTASSCSARSR